MRPACCCCCCLCVSWRLCNCKCTWFVCSPTHTHPHNTHTCGCRFLELAAANGNAEAQRRLGDALWFGDVGKKRAADLEMALVQYETAAARGDVQSTFNVAWALLVGPAMPLAFRDTWLASVSRAYESSVPSSLRRYFRSLYLDAIKDDQGHARGEDAGVLGSSADGTLPVASGVKGGSVAGGIGRETERVGVARDIRQAVEVLKVALTQLGEPGREANYDLDAQALPLHLLYFYCVTALRLEDLASVMAAEYPDFLPQDLGWRVQDAAGQTVAWLSGAFSGLRSAQLLPASAETWPDGEKGSESEAAAEFGLEILIMIVLCSVLVPVMLRVLETLLFDNGVQHAHAVGNHGARRFDGDRLPPDA